MNSKKGEIIINNEINKIKIRINKIIMNNTINEIKINRIIIIND